MRVGDYVRICEGGKVYQVTWVRDDRVGDGQVIRLAPTADHPDAAKRMQDALRIYVASQLIPVRRR